MIIPPNTRVQFKFSTWLDKVLITFGSLAALCGGAALPILMILKGIAVQVDHLIHYNSLQLKISHRFLLVFLRALLMTPEWGILEPELTMMQKMRCLKQ